MKKFVDGAEVDMTPEEIAEIEAWRSAPVPFAVSKAEKLAKFRADRLALLDVISGMGWAALVDGDNATATALAAFRVGLLDLPQHAAVTAATDIDGLSVAMAVRYKQLTDALPAAVKTGFRELVQ